MNDSIYLGLRKVQYSISINLYCTLPGEIQYYLVIMLAEIRLYSLNIVNKKYKCLLNFQFRKYRQITFCTQILCGALPAFAVSASWLQSPRGRLYEAVLCFRQASVFTDMASALVLCN